MTEAKNSNQKSSIVGIHQATAGTIGDCVIGVLEVRREKDSKSNQETLAATISVWPTTGVQKQRNDFVAKHTVQQGDVIPACGRFLRIESVIDEKNRQSIPKNLRIQEIGRGLVLVDSTPVAVEGVSLQPGSFAITLGSTGELHGCEIELTGLDTRVVKGAEALVAKLDLWPNDFEKADAKQQGLIRSIEASAAGDVKIGDKFHKVLSLNAGTAGARGWIELSQ